MVHIYDISKQYEVYHHDEVEQDLSMLPAKKIGILM
jgi:hypothetical protein